MKSVCDLSKSIGDKDGNLYSQKNINELCEKFKNSFSLITADGGFNERNDYNNKERLHHRLFFCEILTALFTQKPGGCFVVKFFDLFTQFSAELVYILSLFYNVSIYKPETSRPTNSEKYIVCTNFAESKELFEFKNRLKSLVNVIFGLDNTSVGIFQSFDGLDTFYSKLADINCKLHTSQVMYIEKNLKLAQRGGTLEGYGIKTGKNSREWMTKYYY